VAACELAALAGAVASAEVGYEQAALVAVACVRLALTEVGLQEIASRMPVSGELTSAGPAGPILAGLAGPILAGLEGRVGATGPAGGGAVEAGDGAAEAGREITGAGVGAQPRWERVWPMLPLAPTATRTMTTMATAVTDTDRTDHMRRHLDLDSDSGHLRVHGVPDGGGDQNSRFSPRLRHLFIGEPELAIV
jgi:hypothetical protein